MIARMVNKFNGELLERLYMVSKNAPEFYYETMSKKGTVELFDLLKFSNELGKLFKFS